MNHYTWRGADLLKLLAAQFSTNLIKFNPIILGLDIAKDKAYYAAPPNVLCQRYFMKEMSRKRKINNTT